MIVAPYARNAFVNTKGMFARANAHKYGVGAYNTTTPEQTRAILSACAETNSPALLAASPSAIKHNGMRVLVEHISAAVSDIRAEGSLIPVALHLDHGATFQLCLDCIVAGFSSVMIDASKKDLEGNIALTKQVVEVAEQYGVSVEAELGKLAGVEDEVSVSAAESSYTDPAEVEEFVDKTGVHSLAIAIGTSHGAQKFKPKDGEAFPELAWHILENIQRRLGDFPLVLHGASTVDPDSVAIFNAFGGKLEQAVGVPEDYISRAIKGPVVKVNTDTDLRIAGSGAYMQFQVENPKNIDWRKPLAAATAAMREVVVHKNNDVFLSAGHGVS
ncbi:MAG: ketose-bisphosphate aldolase [Candidatus Saganbacteria bacterium]|nr:ketose-bisphosphate aldolase [Candidatus Saganbacteria bacterium]